jgi:hypothetical protein
MIRVHGLCARWGMKRRKKGCWTVVSENRAWSEKEGGGGSFVWGSFVL